MSNTIELKIVVDANNIQVVTDFLNRISVQSKGVKNIDVVEAEEVGETAAAKTPAKRASRAKPKPDPEVEEDNDEDFDIDGDETGEEGVTLDELKELNAKKIDKHRETIIAQFKKLGCKGYSTLDPSEYQNFYDFLNKLK